MNELFTSLELLDYGFPIWSYRSFCQSIHLSIENLTIIINQRSLNFEGNVRLVGGTKIRATRRPLLKKLGQKTDLCAAANAGSRSYGRGHEDDDVGPEEVGEPPCACGCQLASLCNTNIYKKKGQYKI